MSSSVCLPSWLLAVLVVTLGGSEGVRAFLRMNRRDAAQSGSERGSDRSR